MSAASDAKAVVSANETAAKGLQQFLRTDRTNYGIAKLVFAARSKGGTFRGMAERASYLRAETVFAAEFITLDENGERSEFQDPANVSALTELSKLPETKGGTLVSHVTLSNSYTAWKMVLAAGLEPNLATIDEAVQLVRKSGTAGESAELVSRVKALTVGDEPATTAEREAYFIATSKSIRRGLSPFVETTDTRVESIPASAGDADDTVPEPATPAAAVPPSVDVIVATIQGWADVAFSPADRARILGAMASFTTSAQVLENA